MTAFDASTTQLSDPTVRSHAYRLFARGFTYPTRAAFELYRSGQWINEILANCAALPHLAELAASEAGLAAAVQAELRALPWEEFESAYVAAFDVGFPEPPCPPYEGLYHEGMPRTEVMLEVAAFYAHFGLAMNQAEGRRELPDYLCAELEFLHFLTFKEAQAGSAGQSEFAAGYRRAQHDFLERHLAAWLPAFTARVQAVPNLAFYPHLARLLGQFVQCEFALLGAAIP